jgi:hypothetical protein
MAVSGFNRYPVVSSVKEATHPAESRNQSMIPKKPAPDLIRGGYRFSEKIMLQPIA